jgi:hypothetical protein
LKIFKEGLFNSFGVFGFAELKSPSLKGRRPR